MKILYADKVNYWKTSSTSPDKWMLKTMKLITSIGGIVQGQGFGSDVSQGKAAYMLTFELEEQRFKIVWPVLSTRYQDDDLAARRQATTFIYHDVKARVMSAKVLGTRAAFFGYLQLPDGRTLTQVTLDDVLQGVPLFEAKVE